MSSFDRQKKDSSSESAPLLQRQQQQRNPAQPGVSNGYESAGIGAPAPGIPQQYGSAYANNGMAGGSSYFMPPPQHYSIPIQQPHIIHSPNQPHQVVGPGEGTGGMMPQPPFYYPFQAPEGGAMPQYPYPVYPVQQQQQRQQSRMAPNGSTPLVNTISHSPTASGGLPPMNDIFNAPGGRESQSSGYGTLSTTPKIYNAPVNRRPPSGRRSQEVPQTMRRTNSSNELKQLQKGGSSATKEHRRVHSDSPLRLNRLNRRANTDEAPASRGSGGHQRARTLSGGNPFARPRHRRGDSSSSYHSMGGGSYNAGSIADSSQVSMRSNIARSSLFAGVDEEGRPLLYYPYEAIRLVMIPDHEKQKNRRGLRRGDYDSSDEDTAEEEDHLPLVIGHLYADEPANVEDYYEDYHRVSDDLEQGITPQWESLDTHPLRKNRKSGNEGFTEEDKQELLPPTNYVVAVSDDIYKRMFSEVAAAQSMPCGLFFCGHHEDVDYPSVWIPATLVIILFSTLLYLSYLTEG